MNINPEKFFSEYDWHNPDNTKLALDFLKQYPEVKSDIGLLSPVTEKLFAIKNALSRELESQVSNIFWEVHHLKATELKGLSESNMAAGSLETTYPDAEAFVNEGQNYPVPLSLLKGEKIACKDYFATFEITIGKVTFKIPQGFLARFSPRIEELIHHSNLHELALEGLESDHFDILIAFLETGGEYLFTKENAFPLFIAATHLMISEVADSAVSYIIKSNPPFERLPELLAPNGSSKAQMIVEQAISKHVLAALKNEDHDKLMVLKQITVPYSLHFARSQLTDDQLKFLSVFVIEGLDISQCPELTNAAFSCLNVKKLLLKHNKWVDDQTLKAIPKGVEALDLEGCVNFSGSGLASLTFLKELSLRSCWQLADHDFTKTGDPLEKLNVSNCKNIGNTAIDHFGSRLKIKNLNLSSSGAKEVDRLENGKIEMLYLDSLILDDQQLLKLPNTLKILSLNHCTGISENGLIKLVEQMPLLKTLYVWGCKAATPDFVASCNSKITVFGDNVLQQNFTHGIKIH